MFKKVSQSLKYDSNIFLTTNIYIYTRTPRPITLPRSRCACGVKICAIGEQNVLKLKPLGGQRINQKRKKGWGRGSREGIEKGSKERIVEIEKRHKGNRVNNLKRSTRNIDTCLCLFPQGTAFLLSSLLDSAVKRCSSEVLNFSFQRSGSVKGLARRDLK